MGERRRGWRGLEGQFIRETGMHGSRPSCDWAQEGKATRRDQWRARTVQTGPKKEGR